MGQDPRAASAPFSQVVRGSTGAMSDSLRSYRMAPPAPPGGGLSSTRSLLRLGCLALLALLVLLAVAALLAHQERRSASLTGSTLNSTAAAAIPLCG